MPLRSLVALRSVLLPALAAGIAAGLLTALLQELFLVPMILQAEALELGGAEHVHRGLDRAVYTALFDCLGAFGFALLLAAALAWRGPVSWKQGLVWGLAGYASFSLAPSLGLPPELPGVEAAALAARQLWWIGCAVATAAGIAWCAFGSPRHVRLLGLVLIVMPHFIGAPISEGLTTLPDGLSRNFALGSLAVSLALWVVIGIVTAILMSRAMSSRSIAGTASSAST